MHPSVMAWVGDIAAKLPHEGAAVVELGSYNENGTVRPLFEKAGSYVGVDVRDGPGVDRVSTEGWLPFDDLSVDIVVTTEMLEHDLNPWATVAEAQRILRAHGTLIVTCRGYDERGCYPIHDWRDCWRFTAEGLEALLVGCRFRVDELLPDPTDPGVFALAVKL